MPADMEPELSLFPAPRLMLCNSPTWQADGLSGPGGKSRDASTPTLTCALAAPSFAPAAKCLSGKSGKENDLPIVWQTLPDRRGRLRIVLSWKRASRMQMDDPTNKMNELQKRVCRKKMRWQKAPPMAFQALN
jgi:hypothetical protein